MKRIPKIGLALGGGSVRGLANIGVLKVLEGVGITVDAVAGTSMGAIVGAIYSVAPNALSLEKRALGFLSSKEFKDIGLEFLRKDSDLDAKLFARLAGQIREKYIWSVGVLRPSLIPGEKLERALDWVIPDIDVSETQIPFAAVALDLQSGEDVIMTDGSLRRAVLASSSIPGVFPPVQEGEQLLTDGGPTSIVPVRAARAIGAEVVIAIDLRPELGTDTHPASGLDVMFRTDDILRFRYNESQVALADIVIRPDVGNIHWANFTRAPFCIRVGEEATRRQIDEILMLARGRGAVTRAWQAGRQALARVWSRRSGEPVAPE
ncbi:hypothetical protein AMJ39_06110 [candidate division TA06 bacterium DG_24]|uniref:PNPLA domain-containing protein n=3 Tax=Bacteria division TA06 TaxID=1156500 RepID=A0A0S8JE39_UNCT6|nr:MAG: hypothetical protein AMJ39_06110 [candidate division TA06 bacterium DG_24]KPK70409.1 MAG: hypothetical protein AMJ82_03355 [candidate division TA06 bacterium SM23_40]KPL07943.1 MAG: hypothetical protein AMJ71_08650 [candidate division TA06 bacterium SM1_40]